MRTPTRTPTPTAVKQYVDPHPKGCRHNKKRADEIWIAEIEAEAEDKKKADELQAEKKKRADESHIKIQISQIEPAKEQAKIEADKEFALKELEVKSQQHQASTSLAAAPPPRNKDAKSPKLPSFIDEKYELDSYLLRFECYAENVSCEKTHGLLS